MGENAEGLGATEPDAAPASAPSSATAGQQSKRDFDEILSDLEETDRLTNNMLQLRDKLSAERKEIKAEIKEFITKVKEEHGREPNAEEKKVLAKPYKRFKALSTELEALQAELSKRKKQILKLRAVSYCIIRCDCCYVMRLIDMCLVSCLCPRP